jgi:manganese/zinc/iron transport system permease protein
VIAFVDYTLRTVALGAAVLGIVAGSLGTFAVLRRQSLLGDAISHAALPGIALAFLLTGSKAPLVLTVGAALAGFAATLVIMAVVRNTRVKYDSALGLVLSVFFGFGLVLLTYLQTRPDASQAGLDRYLFGQAAALLQRDVVTMAALGGGALLLAALFWKELKVLSFDPDFGATLGLRMRAFDVLLTGLLVVAIAIGLQTVGVVLMSAMIVAPAAAARQWTDRLALMTVLAAVFGAAAGIAGALVSASAARMPTGPTIVLWLTVLVVVSLLFAPARGLVWGAVRARRNAARLRLGTVLGDLEALAAQHESAAHAHPAAVLRVMAGGRDVEPALSELERRGWARRNEQGDWALTDAGRDEAQERAEERRV